MNKYQQKLIELLSDYMDKTLIAGCLISLHKGEYSTFIKMDGKNFYTAENNLVTLVPKYCNIIGNFTMDAVLKYMHNKKENQISITKEYLLFGSKYTHGSDAIKIPNKPLSTFTEEEHKALYNNLKGLCG